MLWGGDLFFSPVVAMGCCECVYICVFYTQERIPAHIWALGVRVETVPRSALGLGGLLQPL